MEIRLMTVKTLLLISQVLCSKRFLLLFNTTFRYFRKCSYSYQQRRWQNLGFVIRSTHERSFTGDDKGVTDQGHLTEKLMNKLQNRYGIVLEQNVD